MVEYVAHDCRGTRDGSCNNRWIDKDKTKCKTQIPTWKYCRECCAKLGIDFDKQKPSDYMDENSLQKRRENMSKAREQNIKSE